MVHLAVQSHIRQARDVYCPLTSSSLTLDSTLLDPSTTQLSPTVKKDLQRWTWTILTEPKTSLEQLSTFNMGQGPAIWGLSWAEICRGIEFQNSQAYVMGISMVDGHLLLFTSG